MIEVRCENGTLAMGFERPAQARAPAVLLLPAIAGVNDYVRATAARLVSAGYAVLTLDYYAREGVAADVSTPAAISAAVAALPDPRVLSDARAAVAALRERAEVDSERIAAFGFCIGGMYAYLAACEIEGLSCAVDYYGAITYGSTSENKPVSPLDRAAELKAPLLGHFGTWDRLISTSDIDAFEAALQAASKPYELFRYAGAPHAFDEDHRPAVYRSVASRLAWERSLTFLDWHLRRRPGR